MTNQEMILQKALSLFTHLGYENVGVQKIVSEAQVSKPTLYHYFGSKKGLLKHLLHSLFDGFLSSLEEKAAYHGDVVHTLEEIARLYFDFADKQKDFYRFTMSLTFSSPDSEAWLTVQPFIDDQYKILQGVFKQAENDHGNMKGRSQRYSLSFLGTVNAYISASQYNNKTLSQEDVYQVCRQFMYGIFS